MLARRANAGSPRAPIARTEPDRAVIVSERSPARPDVAPAQRREITLATVYVRVMPLFHKTMYTETIISAVIA